MPLKPKRLTPETSLEEFTYAFADAGGSQRASSRILDNLDLLKDRRDIRTVHDVMARPSGLLMLEGFNHTSLNEIGTFLYENGLTQSWPVQSRIPKPPLLTRESNLEELGYAMLVPGTNTKTLAGNSLIRN